MAQMTLQITKLQDEITKRDDSIAYEKKLVQQKQHELKDL